MGGTRSKSRPLCCQLFRLSTKGVSLTRVQTHSLLLVRLFFVGFLFLQTPQTTLYLSLQLQEFSLSVTGLIRNPSERTTTEHFSYDEGFKDG